MQADRCRRAPPEAVCFELRFAAGPMSVRMALHRITADFSHRLCPQDAGALEVALAEVLNNVVEHAYAGSRGGDICLRIEARATALHCTVTDHGTAMPGGVPPPGGPDPGTGNGGRLREGGWGWHLVRSLTRDLAYTRIGTENRLSFRIELAG